jgi:hypothetical protein
MMGKPSKPKGSKLPPYAFAPVRVRREGQVQNSKYLITMRIILVRLWLGSVVICPAKKSH